MSYSEYVPKHERPVISALIQSLLDKGLQLTVNDTEDDLISRSTNHEEIRSALGGCGEDYISFDGGYFYLIYNNGSDGDPMVVIADYTCGDIAEKVWNELDAKYGDV